LRPFGKTIPDAVDFYLNHLEVINRSVPLHTAMKELIENRRLSGATKRCCYDLELHIGRFCAAFPDRIIAEITTAEIDDGLYGLRLAPVTRNTFRRDLRTLFSFARTRRYCTENRVIQTIKAKEIDGDIQILTVDQTTKLLELRGHRNITVLGGIITPFSVVKITALASSMVGSAPISATIADVQKKTMRFAYKQKLSM
jgi:hypothetical protein